MDLSIKRYLKVIFRQALKYAYSSVFRDSFSIFKNVTTFALAFLFIWFFLGKQIADTEARIIIITGASLGFWFVVVYFFNCFVGMPKMWVTKLLREKSSLKKKVSRLESQMKPDIQVFFEPGNPDFVFRESTSERDEYDNLESETVKDRALLLIKNNSNIASVENLEVYCTRLEALPSSERKLGVKWTQGENKRELEPGNKLFVGIVERENYEEYRGPDGSYERFNITIPWRGSRASNSGSKFEIDIIVVGKNIPHQELGFEFGLVEGSFYIKQRKYD